MHLMHAVMTFTYLATIALELCKEPRQLLSFNLALRRHSDAYKVEVWQFWPGQDAGHPHESSILRIVIFAVSKDNQLAKDGVAFFVNYLRVPVIPMINKQMLVGAI